MSNLEFCGYFVGMENGNRGHAVNGNGEANGHVEHLRPIYYRVLGGGSRI